MLPHTFKGNCQKIIDMRKRIKHGSKKKRKKNEVSKKLISASFCASITKKNMRFLL
jgi:hypothetical protein